MVVMILKIIRPGHDENGYFWLIWWWWWRWRWWWFKWFYRHTRWYSRTPYHDISLSWWLSWSHIPATCEDHLRSLKLTWQIPQISMLKNGCIQLHQRKYTKDLYLYLVTRKKPSHPQANSWTHEVTSQEIGYEVPNYSKANRARKNSRVFVEKINTKLFTSWC